MDSYEQQSPDFWPQWLDRYRVQDAALGSAYAHTPASCRAALKSGIALAFFHFGQSQGLLHSLRRDQHLGYLRKASKSPAPWAVIAFPASYSAAARLTCACICAQLADVRLIGAFCIGGQPSPQALVSLELAGIEDIFALEDKEVVRLLSTIPEAPRGRLALLDAEKMPAIREQAYTLRIPVFEERQEPELFFADADAFQPEILRFCQGEAAATALRNDPHKISFLDAIYAKDATAEPENTNVRLTLSPGCEGFWLFQGLDPDFFCENRLEFAPLLSKE